MSLDDVRSTWHLHHGPAALRVDHKRRWQTHNLLVADLRQLLVYMSSSQIIDGSGPVNLYLDVEMDRRRPPRHELIEACISPYLWSLRGGFGPRLGYAKRPTL